MTTDSGLMLEIDKVVDDYMARGLVATENANTSWGPNGLLFAVGGHMLELHYLKEMRAAGHGELADLHGQGYVHIHDLSLGKFTPYCCGHSLQNLLETGLRAGFIRSSPARHLRTAVNHIVNYIGAASNEWAGAQAFSDVDLWLAPYLYKHFLDVQRDYGVTEAVARKMCRNEARQAMQELIFPLNVTNRYGAQSPFSNISLALEVPADMKNQLVLLCGGKTFADLFPETLGGKTITYEDLAPWVHMLAEAIIEVYLAGDARKLGFTFPVLNLNFTEALWNNPLKGRIFKLAAKFGSPYFANYINGLSGGQKQLPSDVRSMCCRMSIDVAKMRAHAGGIFGNADQTGSLQVVTLSLPALAMRVAAGAQVSDMPPSAEKKQKGKKAKRPAGEQYDIITAFLAEVARVMDIAAKEQKWKRDTIEKMYDAGFYQTAKSNFHHGLKNFYTTIGYVGLWETIQILTGDEDSFAAGDNLELARKVMQFMADRCQSYYEHGLGMVNFEATPAEAAAHKLALKAIKMYPDIPRQGDDVPYFCNSCHLPPRMQGDLPVALESQHILQPIHTGGTVYHYHTGEDLTAASVETILQTLMATNMPQVTISPVYSVCPACGARFPGHVKECPNEHTPEQIAEMERLYPDLVISE